MIKICRLDEEMEMRRENFKIFKKIQAAHRPLTSQPRDPQQMTALNTDTELPVSCPPAGLRMMVSQDTCLDPELWGSSEGALLPSELRSTGSFGSGPAWVKAAGVPV